MVVRAVEVTEQFDGLLSGLRSREDVEAWAEARRRAEDKGRLEYEPRADQARLWDAITYLSGVELRAGPGAYLHAPEDLLQFRRAADL